MAVLLIVAVALGSLAASYAAIESHSFLGRLKDLESRGSRVIHFGSTDPQKSISISRVSCEALARRDGVERSGMLEMQGNEDVAQFGRRAPVFGASTSLFPRLSSSDGIVGAGLSSARSDISVRVGASGSRRLAVGERQPEGIPTNSALIFPLASAIRASGNCVVVADRFANPQALIQLLSPQLHVDGGEVSGRVQLTQSSDPVADWLNRPLQLLAVLLGFSGGLVQGLTIWSRGSEMAAYRLSGTTRIQLGWLLTFETIVCAGAFASAAAAAAFAQSEKLIDLPATVLWALCGGGAWLIGTIPSLARSAMTSAATLARER